MKYMKRIGLAAALAVFAIQSIAQTVINQNSIPGYLQAIRTGTYSNRTIDGLNLNNPWNNSPKTWTFDDYTSWDSKFYDGKNFTNGVINAGSNLLNSATANFTSADLGKQIEIAGAGPFNLGVPPYDKGAPLITTISAINSTTQVTLAAAASKSVTATTFRYGFKPAYTEGHLTKYSSYDFDMNYRFLFPVGYNLPQNASYKYPLILFIHGAGERGNCWNSSCFGNLNDTYSTNKAYLNNDINLVHGGQTHLEAIYNPTTGSNGKLAEDPTLPTRAFPGFVLIPQGTSGTFYQYDQFINLLELLITTYRIDPDRIYVHGLSNGGAASWEVLRRKPQLFAAALPMSAVSTAGDAIFNSEVNKAVPIPTWIFQGGTDGAPTPNNTNQIVSKLRAAGASVRYTIYPTVGHGTWGFAYAEPDFFSWMLLRNKRDITVLYGDPTICPTNSNGVKLALSVGFLAYQWELDGAIIPLATSSTYTATQPGTYRARFSRISATPSEEQWNLWSKPVVVQEATPITTTITAVGTSHLPDINGGTSVRINGPTTKDLVKLWYRNGVQTTSYTNNAYFYPYTDTASYTVRTDAGKFTLKTFPFSGCQSLESNPIYVTVGVTPSLITPASLTATATSSSSVQLFWTDNTPNETGFEIYRATNPSGPYNFFKLVNAGSISYADTGLAPSTTYYYQLRAVNNTDKSNYTGNVMVSTPGDTQPPTAPQNLVSGLKTLTSINLSWAASTDNTGIQQYQISYTGATSGTINTGNATTSFNVTSLTGNANYFFTVKAIDLAGNSSQASNQLVTSTIFSGLNYSYSAVNVDLLTNAGNNWNTPETTGTRTDFVITPRGQDDYFNFKFEGYISLPAGSYNFRSQSDDGSMVFVGAEGASTFPFNGTNFTANLAFTNDGLHGCSAGSATPVTYTFSGNAARPITVIMFEKTGGECLSVEYIRVGGGAPSSWTRIPTNVLFSGTPPILTPPATPSGLTAVAAGMSSINLSWTATPYPNNLKVVVLGSSTAVGTGASSTANSWVGELTNWLSANTTGSTVTNLALGGFTTYHVRADGSTGPFLPDVNRNITKAISLSPSIILVNLPSNNVANGIPISTTMSHYAELKTAADAAGVPILFTTTQPRDFNLTDTGLRHLLQDEAVALRAAYGNNVIDIYDYLTDFTNDNRIKTIVSALDGIHLNDAGHDYIFNKALDKLLQQYKKYEVYRSTDAVNNFNIIATVGINSFGDTNLLPSTTYYYKLKATSSGGSSAFSATASAATTGDIVAPSIPTGVTILSSNYTSVGIQWTAATDNVSVTGYRIYANGILLGTSSTPTYSSTALLPGTNYGITVSAYDASGNSSAQSSPPTNFSTNGPLTFYSKPSSNLSITASWGTNTDGTGTPPTSFAYDGQYFEIPSPQVQTLTSALTIGGTISRVIVDDGAALTISQPLTGTLKVGNGSTLNVNVDYQPVFETIDPTSTINFNTYSTVPVAAYGNLNLNGSGLKSVGTGTLEVQGNLTLANGIGLKGAADNLTTIKVKGDLITAATVATAPADNRVALQFVGPTSHNLTVGSDQFIYQIAADAGAFVTFNNTSGTPKSLNLGSPNGGGLDLANGSTLILGSNHLILKDNATVNPGNTTGEISINNANISLTTSAATAANFYFNSSNNKVQNFTLQSTAGGTTFIRKGMEINDGLKINNGILNAGGFITLKSSATASAAIQQIVSGSITGNVKVERYIAPKRVYRYMSTPVQGARVADWQNYFPVTGGFIGGTGNASLFYYVEPAYVAYPTTAMDNTAPLQVGRGYAAFIRENVNPITMVSTGVPNQGPIPFTLTGGTVASNTGYNLVGNPYASDIVWRNTGWASTNVSDIIWVRQNNADGSYIFLNWNRNGGGVGFGTLPNGKIPAGQGFWVQATTASPTLSISESAKTTDPASGNANFFRSETEVNTSLFSLKLINGTNQDYAFVNLTDVGSDLYDKLRDGAKRPNSFFNLSTTSVDNVPLAMNDAGNTFCEKIISVNLQPGENQSTLSPGSYSIQFENLENFSLANIELVDSFLGTTTSIDKNSAVYNLTVTTDVASYTNRLSLKLTRPSMLTNNVLTSAKDLYCKSEQNVILSIVNSQIGVNYEAISATSDVLSDKVVGNGETIQLTISTKDLTGQNIIKVRSYFPGCSSAILVNNKTITVSELPSLTAPSEVFGCIGSKVTITANGNGSTYQWVNQNGNQTLSESSKSVEVYALDPISSYSVKAINDNGCQSESKNIVVRADDLERPTITLSSNGVLQTDASRSIQWLLNGNVLSGANDISYSPTQSGLYSVRAANTFCVKESSPIEYLVTGLEDPTKGTFSLSVYPNPSEIGEIRVIGNSSVTTPLQLLITDILGKELINQPMASEDFNNGVAVDTKWTSGIYIVRVTQNGTSLHQKVIIR